MHDKTSSKIHCHAARMISKSEFFWREEGFLGPQSQCFWTSNWPEIEKTGKVFQGKYEELATRKFEKKVV